MNKKDEALKAAKEFIKQVDYPPYDDRNLLEVIEEALGQKNDEIEILKLIANRAKSFPNFPMGYHLQEVFAYLGEKQPIKEALEQPARLVSYAPDGSTCTLNIDGEEVYFNREHPEQSPIAYIKQGSDGYPKLVFNGRFEYDSITAKQTDIALFANPARQPAQDDIEKRLDYAHARGFKEGAENVYKKMKQPAQEPVAYDKLTNDEKASIKRQINNAFNDGFEKGKAMSLVASIPPNFIKLESIDKPAPQPAQEPVAWRNPNDNDRRHAFMWNTDARDKEKYTVALYTHPAPSWQGLSEEEFIYFTHWVNANVLVEIEQALKEKNGLA